PDDVDGYEQIRRHTTIGLAGGESEFGIFGFRELLRRRALDIVQPDIARVGGFTAAMRLGGLGDAHHVRYSPPTGFSCAVAQLGSSHLAAAVPNLWRVEEMFIDNPLAPIFTEPLPKATKGVVAVPTRAGVGLTLDKKKIARYRLT